MVGGCAAPGQGRGDRSLAQGSSGGVGKRGLTRRSTRRFDRCRENSAPQTTRNATTPAATAAPVGALSRPGFIGGYDALASRLIIVWSCPISQSFSYSAGG